MSTALEVRIHGVAVKEMRIHGGAVEEMRIQSGAVIRVPFLMPLDFFQGIEGTEGMLPGDLTSSVQVLNGWLGFHLGGYGAAYFWCSSSVHMTWAASSTASQFLSRFLRSSAF